MEPGALGSLLPLNGAIGHPCGCRGRELGEEEFPGLGMVFPFKSYLTVWRKAGGLDGVDLVAGAPEFREGEEDPLQLVVEGRLPDE